MSSVDADYTQPRDTINATMPIDLDELVAMPEGRVAVGTKTDTAKLEPRSIDVDFSEDPVTNSGEPAWLSKFDKFASEHTMKDDDDKPAWMKQRAASEAPLSWTAPIEKADLEELGDEMPVAASPISSIVAKAEAETKAAVDAANRPAAVRKPKNVAEGTPAPKITAGMRSTTTTLPPPVPARGPRGTLPPLFGTQSSATLRPPDEAALAETMAAEKPARASSPNIVIDENVAKPMPKLPAPSAAWRASGQIAIPGRDPTGVNIRRAPEPTGVGIKAAPEAAPALPPLPRPSAQFQRAPSPNLQPRAATAPVDMFARPATGEVSQVVEEDDAALLAAAKGRSTAKIGALIALGGIAAAGAVYLIARPGSSETKPAAPVVAAAPAPAPAPTPDPTPVAAAPVVEVAPAPVEAKPIEAAPAPVEAKPAPVEAAPAAGTVGMPIVSNPSGATVTLVVNGAATTLGTTPLVANLDPTKSYDIVVAAPGHQTKMQHVEPGTRVLDVDLDGKGAPKHDEPKHEEKHIAVAQPEHHETPAPAPKPVEHHIATATPAPAPAKPAPVVAAKPAPVVAKPAPAPTPAKKPEVAAVAPASGSGVLMISAKPPCEIWVDGKDTHLSTPQKKMTLPAGPHTITLVNTAQHIKGSEKVEILAGLPSRLIKDFTH